MIRNYYTLLKLVAEFQQFAGYRIVECFTQEKQTIMFALYKGEEVRHLQFSASTDSCTLSIRDRYARAKKNTVDLFPEIINRKIISFELIPNERIIKIRL
ncbi:MAG: hypothetical protein WCT77_11855, partial [Bacteroidota bacterium]